MRVDALGLFWQDMPKIKKVKIDEKYLPPVPFWEHETYLPFLKEAQEFNVQLMSDTELLEAYQQCHGLVFDIESYINYFLIAFMDVVTEKVIYFERIADGGWNDDPRKLLWIIQHMLIHGFNSNNYDMCIAAMSLAGKTVPQLKAATNMIIAEGYKPWQVLRKVRVKKLKSNHIDIMEVAPLSASLKIYGGRCGAPKMQDLPFHPELTLNNAQIDITRFYCINDLITTKCLLTALEKDIALRCKMSAQYEVDLRSKSDAQIAEAVIAHELEKLNFQKPVKPQIEPGTAYRYQVPHFMQFQTPLMQSVLNTVANTLFIVGNDGSVGTPPEIAGMKVLIGETTYKIGIGGLHSQEKNSAHFTDDLVQLSDHDVTSFYPFIILNLGLFPKHLGPNFLRVYRIIVETRLKAKDEGDDDTASSLKIVINGTFGKLGSKYSLFYSPDLLVQVTLTGQLSLLMLIEAFELNGIPVVSGNTDGIVIKCPRSKFELRDQILQWWQDVTKFNLEATYYKALCSRGVNDYIAVKEKGGVKGKGAYATPSLLKNPTCSICTEAVKEFLENDVPLEETIRACDDVQKLVAVRRVTGGAVWSMYRDHGEKTLHDTMVQHLWDTGWEPHNDRWVNQQQLLDPEVELDKAAMTTLDAYNMARWMPVESEYLGKAIRWYYATRPEDCAYRIAYTKNGNKVPKSDGAKPLMEFGEGLPGDVDWDWYINEAERILKDVGYPL